MLKRRQTDSALRSLTYAEQLFNILKDTAHVIESKILLARCRSDQGNSKEAVSILEDGLIWCESASLIKIRLLVALAKTGSGGSMKEDADRYLLEADHIASTLYPESWIDLVFPALSLRYAGSGSSDGQVGLLNRYTAIREEAERGRDSVLLKAGKIIMEWERMDSSNAAIKGLTKDRNRILYVMLALLFSALMAVIIIFRQHQRMRAQLRALFRKNLEEMQQAAEVSVVQRVLESESPSNLEEATVQARYQAILQLMERDKPWLDAGFSLQDLSTRLATNQKYISQAINMYSDTGFSGLMNRYRVNEARRLILEGKPDTSLNDIALQVGFTNRVSFYRQFKEITGISPSEFIKLAR
jgi:AraC-like DNA-binding protein